LFKDIYAFVDDVLNRSGSAPGNANDEVYSPIQVPGFNTAPNPGPSERILMQHSANEFTTSAATAKWMQAREKLRTDPDAEIDELIGVLTLQYADDANL
jgi:hypothetical protein